MTSRERAVAARLRRGGAREQLVPGSRSGHGRGRRRSPSAGSKVVTWSRSGWRRIRASRSSSSAPRAAGAFAEARRPAFELLRVLGGAAGRGASDRLVHEVRADLEVDRHVLAGVEPLDEVVRHVTQWSTQAATVYWWRPTSSTTNAARQRSLPSGSIATSIHGPPVVAVAERGEDDVVSVGERVGLDDDPVADHALDREAAAVDERRDPLDHGTTAPIPDVGADVGQWSAADRVLLGMRSRRRAADERGLGARNRRREPWSVSNPVRPPRARRFRRDTNRSGAMRSEPRIPAQIAAAMVLAPNRSPSGAHGALIVRGTFFASTRINLEWALPPPGLLFERH